MKGIYLLLFLCGILFFCCKQKTAIVDPGTTQLENSSSLPTQSAGQNMFDQLEMSNEQRAAFIAIREKYQKIRRSEIRSAQSSPDTAKEKMEAIKRQQETELQNLLTPEQYILYLEAWHEQ